MLENDLVPRQLLLVISATALRCKDPQSSLADEWADEARETVLRDSFVRMSTTNLQTLLLLQRYEWHRGSHLSAWMLAGLAIRLAMALQLYRDPSETRGNASVELPSTVMETRRRLMWSCFAMDSIPDVGHLTMHPSIDSETIGTRLPCPEELYEQDLESNEPTLHNALDAAGEKPSISAYMIRMVLLRVRIIRYSHPFNPQSSAKPHTERPWAAQSEFYSLRADLDEFQEALHKNFPLPPKSSSEDPAQLTALFTIHTMFHAAYTDLLRVGTHKSPRGDFPNPEDNPHSFFESCRRERINQARCIAKVVSMCMQSQCKEHDPFMAICSCVALRILVVERWHDKQQLVNLSSPSTQELLNHCRGCAIKTAAWSKPIRKLLFATSDLLARRGYPLDLSESSLDATKESSRYASRAGTPNLRVYGTAGTMKKAREDHDIESATSPTEVLTQPTPSSEVQSVALVSSGTGNPVQGDPDQAAAAAMQGNGSLTITNPESSQTWPQGPYDWETSMMDVGLADFDMLWSYGQDSSSFGLWNWDVEDAM